MPSARYSLMADRLSKKEAGFVKDYAKTGNGVQSALKNYDTKDYSTAGVIAHENLKKPKIINAIQEALPDEILAEIHREGLYATKPFFDQDGNKIAEDADYAVRHKYLDTAYKIKGSYAAEKHVNVNVEVEASDRIKELAKLLNEKGKQTFTGSSSQDGKESDG